MSSSKRVAGTALIQKAWADIDDDDSSEDLNFFEWPPICMMDKTGKFKRCVSNSKVLAVEDTTSKILEKVKAKLLVRHEVNTGVLPPAVGGHWRDLAGHHCGH